MFGFHGLTDIVDSLIVPLCLLIWSAIIHEIAHGYAALRCGDETAKRAGRLSLNPLVHLDPFGSFVLPLMMMLAGGGALACAKPVPYNPQNLKNPVRDEVIVAFAGPASNLLQACIGALGARVMLSNSEVFNGALSEFLFYVLSLYVYINLVLMFFNLIPFPPLDGSAIISPFLKGQARINYYKVQRYALPVLIAFIYLVPRVMGINPISEYLNLTAGKLYFVLLGF